jgi:hypothetical protein
MAALTDWMVVPEPTDWGDVKVEETRVGSEPYSNHAFVARPLAVTLPFRVAVVVPTDVAANVVTVGAAAGTELLLPPPPPQAVMKRKKQHTMPINEFVNRFRIIISLLLFTPSHNAAVEKVNLVMTFWKLHAGHIFFESSSIFFNNRLCVFPEDVFGIDFIHSYSVGIL